MKINNINIKKLKKDIIHVLCNGILFIVVALAAMLMAGRCVELVEMGRADAAMVVMVIPLMYMTFSIIKYALTMDMKWYFEDDEEE